MKINVRQNGRDDAALRGSRNRVLHIPLRFQYPRLQPFGNQPHEGAVVDPSLHHLQQLIMVDIIKILGDVGSKTSYPFGIAFGIGIGVEKTSELQTLSDTTAPQFRKKKEKGIRDKSIPIPIPIPTPTPST